MNSPSASQFDKPLSPDPEGEKSESKRSDKIRLSLMAGGAVMALSFAAPIPRCAAGRLYTSVDQCLKDRILDRSTCRRGFAGASLDWGLLFMRDGNVMVLSGPDDPALGDGDICKAGEMGRLRWGSRYSGSAAGIGQVSRGGFGSTGRRYSFSGS
jgi:hypothetical protein